MSVAGVARILARLAGDWCRGVAICAAAAVADVRGDLRTAWHLSDAIRDAFAFTPDDLLAGVDRTEHDR